MPQLVITANDSALVAMVRRKVTELGLGLADEFRSQMRLLVRDVINITPPNSFKQKGKTGLEAGKASINRDLGFMGFVPVEIKGHRTITMAFGHPIAPVVVKTHINPKFADPDAFHAQRLRRKLTMKRSRVSRGGLQAFYVDRNKYVAMRERLFDEIGKLASGWIGIAQELKVALPRWISRHAGSVRGAFTVNFDPDKGRFFIYAVNHFPGTSDARLVDDTRRRIEAAKGYRINAIRRGLEGRARRIAAQK